MFVNGKWHPFIRAKYVFVCVCEEMNKDNWNKKNPKNDDNDDEDYHYRLFGYSSLKYPEILTNMIIINTQSEYRKRNKKNGQSKMDLLSLLLLLLLLICFTFNRSHTHK